jgi:hypothetical protein
MATFENTSWSKGTDEARDVADVVRYVLVVLKEDISVELVI